MLQEHFYIRLFLIIVLGILYTRTMMKVAQYKPIEDSKNKHLIIKILGGFFMLFAILQGSLSIYFLTQVNHPTQMIDFVPTPYQVVRPSTSRVLWGYLTSAQMYVITQITGTMTSLALGTYFMCYRKSATRWWKKLMKFIYMILIYMFFCSATDFHYFDFQEFIPLAIYLALIFYALSKVNKSINNGNNSEECKEAIDDNTIENQQEVKNSIEPIEHISVINYDGENHHKKEEIQIDDISEIKKQSLPYNFCRYCGKKIDYVGGVYCKHCGKKIE